jgi:hypothetical protein
MSMLDHQYRPYGSQTNSNNTLQMLHEASALATAGRKTAACDICRQVVQAEPENLAALLWLAHTASDQLEIENAIAKAYDLAPQNLTVLEAINWYNTTYFPEDSTPAQAMTAAPLAPTKEAGLSSEAQLLHTPLGEPILDATNFWMSQNGMILTGAIIFLVLNLGAFINYTFIKGITWTPFGMPRVFYASLAFVFAVMSLIVIGLVLRDIVAPPVKAYGFINNRRKTSQEVKNRMASGTDFYYELDFLSDEAKAKGGHFVKLNVSKSQFEASASTNRAYVEYSKRFGNVKLYQPLRGKY